MEGEMRAVTRKGAEAFELVSARPDLSNVLRRKEN